MAINIEAEGQFERVLREAIAMQTQKLLEEAVVQAKSEFERRVKEALPLILVNVQSRCSMEIRGRELVIKVQLEDNRRQVLQGV